MTDRDDDVAEIWARQVFVARKSAAQLAVSTLHDFDRAARPNPTAGEAA